MLRLILIEAALSLGLALPIGTALGGLLFFVTTTFP